MSELLRDELDAEAVIRLLRLAPHPEGGHFRETFRDPHALAGRAASTAIYFLLRAGEISRWHRVDAAEVWHWYAGAPLALSIARDGEPATTLRLGPAIGAGEEPQAVVPAGAWQQAQSLGHAEGVRESHAEGVRQSHTEGVQPAWTLVGCTVAPGFNFAGFEMAVPGFSPG